MNLVKVLGIIKRAYIVLVAYIWLLCIKMTFGGSDYSEIILVILVPVFGYVFYRVVKYIFFGK